MGGKRSAMKNTRVLFGFEINVESIEKIRIFHTTLYSEENYLNYLEIEIDRNFL